MNKSICCNAEIDYRGGGYDGEDICPIESYCSKCSQLLAINGSRVDDIRDPKTGKLLRKNHKKAKRKLNDENQN